MGQNLVTIEVEGLKAIGDGVLVSEMNFGEQKTKGGLIKSFLSFAAKTSSESPKNELKKFWISSFELKFFAYLYTSKWLALF